MIIIGKVNINSTETINTKKTGEAQRIKSMIDNIQSNPQHISPQTNYAAPYSPHTHPALSPQHVSPQQMSPLQNSHAVYQPAAMLGSPRGYYPVSQPHPSYTPPGVVSRVGEWSL